MLRKYLIAVLALPKMWVLENSGWEILWI